MFYGVSQRDHGQLKPSVPWWPLVPRPPLSSLLYPISHVVSVTVSFSRTIFLKKSSPICDQICVLGSALGDDCMNTCRQQCVHVCLPGQANTLEFILLRALSKRNLCFQNKMSSRIGPNPQVCWLPARAVKSMQLFQLSDVRSVDFFKFHFSFK